MNIDWKKEYALNFIEAEINWEVIMNGVNACIDELNGALKEVGARPRVSFDKTKNIIILPSPQRCIEVRPDFDNRQVKFLLQSIEGEERVYLHKEVEVFCNLGFYHIRYHTQGKEVEKDTRAEIDNYLIEEIIMFLLLG